MKRPQFTVSVLRSAPGDRLNQRTIVISYDANNIQYAKNSANTGFVVSFISSGGLVVVPEEQILEIKFNASSSGAAYCGQCDQSMFDQHLNQKEPVR